MILSIHQPAYLPWLGYFHRIAQSDVHVVLDNVQFEKNSFINRNKIRTPGGWSWLSVPVKTAGKFGDLHINRVEIAHERPWASKHWNSLRVNYCKAPFWQPHESFFEAIYRRKWNRLVELLIETTEYLHSALGIRTQRLLASHLNVSGKKDELILNLCRELGATTYLSGPLGRDYLRENLFAEKGIAIQYDDYSHPEYPQSHPGFEPGMTALDLLLNCGPRSLEILSTQAELIAR